VKPPGAKRRRLDRAAASRTVTVWPDITRNDAHDLDVSPRCWVCITAPALYVGQDGRHVHKACEPRDVGLTDPITSRLAAQRAQKGLRSLLAQALLAELREHPDGMTDDELVDVFPESHPGSRVKRRTDFARAGLVVDSGRSRRYRWGRQQIVWKAVPT
jgi:hypothetical protein